MPDTENLPPQFIAFDWGARHIGVAVIVTAQQISTPLKTLSAERGLAKKEDLEELLTDYNPQGFVVGLPTNMDGSESRETKRARRFGDWLERQYQLPVHYTDERLSTREAIDRQGDPKADHSLAAMVIGETWLADQRNGPCRSSEN